MNINKVNSQGSHLHAARFLAVRRGWVASDKRPQATKRNRAAWRWALICNPIGL